MEYQYGGRYQRLQRIGNGTYGVIYKIRSVPEGKILIAKHIPLHNVEKGKALQEFKILEKLRHHYIVRSEDSFEEEDELILIMEYCGEKDLSWHIEQRRQADSHFSEYLITNWILQLLLAVGFMHSNKIVHRDLKPQNVFVDSEMNLKIGDFGISKLLDSTSQHCQTSAGTPSYMPPEMVDSQDYSFKADIWSLGCVIYEICALQRLFPPKDAQDKPVGLLKMMDMIKHAEIKEIPSLYSNDLRKLVKKMLNRNPEKRPQAGDLLKDKLLVQLMINRINEKDSLRVEYQKGHEAPSLSSSLIDRQAEAVKEEMKQMGIQVGQKLQGLKQKRIERTQLEDYELAIKKKMLEVEKAVKLAFDELYKNGKFKLDPKSESSTQQSNRNKVSNNSSLSNSSDITIQSVQIRSNRQMNPSLVKVAESESAMVDSLPNQSRQSKSTTIKDQSNTKKERAFIKAQSPVPDFQTTVQSQFAESIPAHLAITLESQLTNTLQSSYEQTLKDPQALTATLNKLDYLKNTLQNNPEAVLSNSFLNCTLSLSNDKSLPRRLKEEISSSGSISLELTRHSNPGDFKKEKKSEEMEKGRKRQKKIAQKEAVEEEGRKRQKKSAQKEAAEEEEGDYLMEFDEYNENVEINEKREAELQAMLSLYQEELSRQQSYNAMSEGFKYRQKYLVMSEIKEQSSEGSSIVSPNEQLQ